MLRRSGRVRKILIAVLGVLVVIGAVGLAILPEIVRRIAVSQAAKVTGRVLSLEDVDLNLFTGHLALKGGKVLKRGMNERAFEFERLDVRVDYLPLVRRHVRVTELTLVAPMLTIVRRGPADFDFSDLLEHRGGGDPSAPPPTSPKWTVTLDRVSVQRLTVVARDLTTSPESEWRIDDMTLETRGLTTGGSARPGRLEMKLKLNGAPVAVTSDSVALDPLAVAARVTVEGFDLAPLHPYLASVPAAPRAVRDAYEKIDLVALARPPEAAGAAPATTSSPPGPAGAAPQDFKLKVEQIALRKAEFTFRDEAVKPFTTLVVTDLSADVRDVTWPSTGPAQFAVSMKPPKAGRLELKGAVTPVPLDVEFAISLRGGRIEPFQAYFPVPARFAGSFNSESRNHVTIANGELTATSRGSNWIEKFTVLAPGETMPAARFERLRFDGIDFAWPKYARVAKIALTKPDVRVERDKDGVMSLRRLFAPDGSGAASSPEKSAAQTKTKPGSAAPAEPQKPGGLPIPVEIGTIVIEDGYSRFLDRTVEPAFSQEISRLGLAIEGLSSTPDRRARLATQAVIGGTSAFDLHGEIAPIGEVYADLNGELRDFKLPSVNPYADPVTAWFMKSGELAIKMHFRIEKNHLTADNEIVVKNVTVAPSREGDEVKKKVGLPLGMIVALITDQDNRIKVNVPLSGEVSQVQAGMGDAIWTAVRNAVINIVGAPFLTIGRLLKGSGDTW